MATSSVGSLRANLSASSASFAKDMGKAKQAVRSNAKGMSRAMMGVKKSFGAALKATKMLAVAAVAGAGAVAFMVKQAVNSADKFQKMAQSVGTNVETLSSMKHAADLAGISFESLATGFKMVAKNAMDAAAGTGLAKDAFRALGITVLNTDGTLKDSQDMILEIADKFAVMEDGAGKTALAMKIFGRSGADLIPLLNAGSAGIKEMTDEAKILGITLDTDTAQAAERFNDNLTRLKGVQTGFINQMMEAMLPTLEDYSEGMITSAKETGNMGRAAEVAATGLKLFLTTVALIKGAIVGAGTAMGKFAAGISLLAGGEFKAAWEAFSDVSTGYVQNFTDTVNGISDIWDGAAAKVEAKAPETSDKFAAPVIQTTEKIEAELGKQTDALDSFYTVQDSILMDALNARLDTARKMKEVAVDNDLTFFFDELDSAKELPKELANEFDALTMAINGWGKESADAFTQFVMGGKVSFKDLINSMIADMIRMAAYQLIFGPLFAGIGGLLSGKGFSMGAASFGGGRAGGGRVDSGKFYEVNERGPELLKMGAKQFLMMGNQSGTVVPSDSGSLSSSGGGNPTFVNNWNITAFDSQSVAQAIQSHKGQIEGIIQTAYNKRGRQGPLG